jgi:hypothetical protein
MSLEPYGNHRSTAVEGAEYEAPLSAKRMVEIPSNMKARFEWSSSNCIYAGYAAKGLAEGVNGWMIQKFTYDGDGHCIARNIAYGNWTDRAGYTYE